MEKRTIILVNWHFVTPIPLGTDREFLKVAPGHDTKIDSWCLRSLGATVTPGDGAREPSCEMTFSIEAVTSWSGEPHETVKRILAPRPVTTVTELPSWSRYKIPFPWRPGEQYKDTAVYETMDLLEALGINVDRERWADGPGIGWFMPSPPSVTRLDEIRATPDGSWQSMGQVTYAHCFATRDRRKKSF